MSTKGNYFTLGSLFIFLGLQAFLLSIEAKEEHFILVHVGGMISYILNRED